MLMLFLPSSLQLKDVLHNGFPPAVTFRIILNDRFKLFKAIWPGTALVPYNIESVNIVESNLQSLHSDWLDSTNPGVVARLILHPCLGWT